VGVSGSEYTVGAWGSTYPPRTFWTAGAGMHPHQMPDCCAALACQGKLRPRTWGAEARPPEREGAPSLKERLLLHLRTQRLVC